MDPNDQEIFEFWSTLLHSVTDSDPKDDLTPEIHGPISVLSTPMAIDVSHGPSNVPADGDKAEPGKAIAELGDKNNNEDRQRFTGKQKGKAEEEGEEEEMKNLAKRQRNEARNIVEKRRRTNINTKIETLRELTPNCKKGDKATTLDSVMDNIRSMKLYVETRDTDDETSNDQSTNLTMQRMCPMLPLGMNMDFLAPWFPFMHPNFMITPPPPPFDGYIEGETSDHNEQVVPVATKGFDNQPESSKFM